MNKEECLQIKESLLKLEEALSNLKNVKNHEINIFEAVGVQTQEVKHSAFLSWLIDSSQPHGLNTMFLSALLQIAKENSIYDRSVGVDCRSILVTDHGFSFDNFVSAQDRLVRTERVAMDNTSRTDIFVVSDETRTLLIIENKVFTSTHDNQLLNYESGFSAYDDYKKIYIYLTPNGDMPFDDDGNYCPKWCRVSYKDVLNIVRTILENPPQIKQKNKLVLMLKDYVTMVETNILKENKEIKLLCKKIIRENKQALDLLMSYTDNIDEATEFCIEWIEKNLKNAVIVKHKTSFEFYTNLMDEYFIKHGCKLRVGDYMRLRCCCLRGKGLTMTMSLQKPFEEEWDEAQRKIIEICGLDKKAGSKFCTLSKYSVELLSEEERETDFNNITSRLETRLQELKQKITDFEALLIN